MSAASMAVAALAFVGAVSPTGGISAAVTSFAATSSPFAITCNGIPAIKTLTLLTSTISGRITPNPVVGDSSAMVGTLELHVAVGGTLAALAAGSQLGVTITMGGTVTA
ncbi:MAG TPA: hypothetical protein VMB82_00980, partial [Acidimicrobiales bacterium]|nr:hypothetical protein [Acidimicrobiales bacterium]